MCNVYIVTVKTIVIHIVFIYAPSNFFYPNEYGNSVLTWRYMEYVYKRNCSNNNYFFY